MSGGVIASPQSHKVFSAPRIPSIICHRRCSVLRFSNGLLKFPRFNLQCNSSGDSGENESKTLLDAFFLGKAVGEVLNERMESAVGEFLGVTGRLRAEQQKQVSQFQEEVSEKARRAKEAASREAQGLVSDSTSLGASAANRVPETAFTLPNSVISAASSSLSNEDPLLGMLDED